MLPHIRRGKWTFQTAFSLIPPRGIDWPYPKAPVGYHHPVEETMKRTRTRAQTKLQHIVNVINPTHQILETFRMALFRSPAALLSCSAKKKQGSCRMATTTTMMMNLHNETLEEEEKEMDEEDKKDIFAWNGDKDFDSSISVSMKSQEKKYFYRMLKDRTKNSVLGIVREIEKGRLGSIGLREYNALLHVIQECLDLQDIMYVWQLMEKRGVQPNKHSYFTLVRAMIDTVPPEDLLGMLGHIVENDIPDICIIINFIINEYAVLGKRDEANQVYRYMMDHTTIEPDIFTFNQMIKSLRTGAPNVDKTMLASLNSILDEMTTCGIQPDIITYNSMIALLSSQGRIKSVRKTLHEMRKAGVRPDVISFNGLIKSMATFNRKSRSEKRRPDYLASLVRKVLNEMKCNHVQPDLYTFNQIIGLLAQNGYTEDAENMMDLMQKHFVEPDVVTYNSIIKGYASQSDIDKVKMFFERMLSNHVYPDLYTCNILMGLYVDRMESDKVLDLISMMMQNGIKMDIITFNTLLRLYSKVDHEPYPIIDLAESLRDSGLSLHEGTLYNLLRALMETKNEAYAQDLLENLRDWRFKPNLKLFEIASAVLRHYENVSLMEYAYKVMINQYKIQPTQEMLLSLIVLMRKCGSEERVDIYRQLLKKSKQVLGKQVSRSDQRAVQSRNLLLDSSFRKPEKEKEKKKEKKKERGRLREEVSS